MDTPYTLRHFKLALAAFIAAVARRDSTGTDSAGAGGEVVVAR